MALASPPSARSSIQIHMPLPIGRAPRAAGAMASPAGAAVGASGAAGTVVVSAGGVVVASAVVGTSVAAVVSGVGVDEDVVVGAPSPPAGSGASIRFTTAA